MHTIATLADHLDATPEDVAAIAHQLAGIDGPDTVYGPDTGVGPVITVDSRVVSTGLELTGHAVGCITDALTASAADQAATVEEQIATAERQLDAVLVNAINALAGETVNLLSADQIIEVLRDLGFAADPYGQTNTEFGVEVGKVPGASHDRIVMSAWCWDPRQVPVDDTLSTGWVDVAAVVLAARLHAARRTLVAAEKSFALSASAAQAAGSVTWQDVADLLEIKSRQAANEKCRRWMDHK